MSASISSDVDEAVLSSASSMEEVTTASSVDSAATPSPRPRKGAGKLMNTTSFARRMAHGAELTDRDQELISSGTPSPVDRDDSEISFNQCPQDEICSDIKRNMHIAFEDVPFDKIEAEGLNKSEKDGTEAMKEAGVKAGAKSESDAVGGTLSTTAMEIKSVTEIKISSTEVKVSSPAKAASPKAPSSATPSRPTPKKTNNDNNKNAFDAFGEYVSFFWHKAEVYEEELELRQSQRNLQDKMDKQRHGRSKRNVLPMSPEGDGSTSSEDDISIDGKINEISVVGKQQMVSLEYKNENRSSTPQLSDSMEAAAAVEAISNFRSLKEVKKEFKEKHSFDTRGGEPQIQKKQRVVDGEAPSSDRVVEVVDESTKKKQRVVDRKAPSSDRVEEVVDESTKKKWKEQWEVFVKDKKKNKYNEVAIQSLALPLTVDEFYHQVLEDNATQSFEKFMRDIGELNVKSTPWQPSKAPTPSEPNTRSIQYTHPVNAPMAPPTAKAFKQQVLHKFGTVGMCLDTCTVVQEVPMADCFVVNDRLWVHEAEDENTGTVKGCIVAVTYEIKFVKSTMFRRIIESQTRKEYALFWNQYADMVRSLKSPLALEEAELEDELEDVAMELEEATALLEDGQEVPLSSVLGRIRSSSRRLSGVAKLPSARKMIHLEEAAEEKLGIDILTLETFILDGIACVRQKLAEGDIGFVLAGAAFCFMFFITIMSIRQMMLMNGFLQNLDARLEKMNQVNEMLLKKLENGSVCGD